MTRIYNRDEWQALTQTEREREIGQARLTLRAAGLPVPIHNAVRVLMHAIDDYADLLERETGKELDQ